MSAMTTVVANGRKGNSMEQPTLFGEVPESEIETESSSNNSVDVHSSVVETKNRINSTNQNRIKDNNVAVINIDADGEYFHYFNPSII